MPVIIELRLQLHDLQQHLTVQVAVSVFLGRRGLVATLGTHRLTFLLQDPVVLPQGKTFVLQQAILGKQTLHLLLQSAHLLSLLTWTFLCIDGDGDIGGS